MDTAEEEGIILVVVMMCGYNRGGGHHVEGYISILGDSVRELCFGVLSGLCFRALPVCSLSC